MTSFTIFSFLLVGIISGLLAGLFGIGGGIIVVPSLLLLFRFLDIPTTIHMQLAIGTSLAAMVLTTLSASFSHYRKKAIVWPFFGYLGIGNILGSLCGAYLTDAFPSKWLQIIFGLFECLIGIRFLFPQKAKDNRKKCPPTWLLTIAGFIIATFSTILGIGGGLIQVPLLHYFHLPIKKAIGTSSALSLVIAITGSVSLLFLGIHTNPIPESMGFIYIPAFISIGITAILAAPLGVKLVHLCSPASIRKSLAIILLIVGLLVITSA